MKITLLKLCSHELSYDELMDMARKATADSTQRKILLPTRDAVMGRCVEVLLFTNANGIVIE